MSEHEKQESQAFSKQESNKPGPKPKQVKLKNTTSRLITLIASRDEKVRILPTEEKEVSGKFLAEIKKNAGAMSFFDSGELVEV